MKVSKFLSLLLCVMMIMPIAAINTYAEVGLQADSNTGPFNFGMETPDDPNYSKLVREDKEDGTVVYKVVWEDGTDAGTTLNEPVIESNIFIDGGNFGYYENAGNDDKFTGARYTTDGTNPSAGYKPENVKIEGAIYTRGSSVGEYEADMHGAFGVVMPFDGRATLVAGKGGDTKGETDLYARVGFDGVETLLGDLNAMTDANGEVTQAAYSFSLYPFDQVIEKGTRVFFYGAGASPNRILFSQVILTPAAEDETPAPHVTAAPDLTSKVIPAVQPGKEKDPDAVFSEDGKITVDPIPAGTDKSGTEGAWTAKNGLVSANTNPSDPDFGKVSADQAPVQGSAIKVNVTEAGMVNVVMEIGAPGSSGNKHAYVLKFAKDATTGGEQLLDFENQTGAKYTDDENINFNAEPGFDYYVYVDSSKAGFGTVTFDPFPAPTSTPDPKSVLEYEVINNEVKITGYKGSSQRIDIPEEIDGYPVTSIGYAAFRDCESLRRITMPNSLKTIEDWAFDSCSSLVDITIPDNVTTIGDKVFYGCLNLANVSLGIGITSVRDNMFSGCSGLRSVALSDSVTSIGSSAFYNCSYLESIDIPDSVTSIGENAFSGCTGLNSVKLGSGITAVGDNMFYGCRGLRSVTLSDSVTSIGSSAFYNCSYLESIDIPDSVTSIGENAFYGCSGLSSVKLGSGITAVGDNMFSDCRGLRSVIMSGSVTSIGSRAFYNCYDLASIDIPDSVTSIDSYAFYGCRALESVRLPAGITTVSNKTFSGCKNLASINIPENVTTIGSYAFENCERLLMVNIPASVVTIGYFAFSNCIRIHEVYYGGDTAKWSEIEIGSGNDNLTGAIIHYNENMPTSEPTAPAKLYNATLKVNDGEGTLAAVATEQPVPSTDATAALASEAIAEVAELIPVEDGAGLYKYIHEQYIDNNLELSFGVPDGGEVSYKSTFGSKYITVYSNGQGPNPKIGTAKSYDGGRIILRKGTMADFDVDLNNVIAVYAPYDCKIKLRAGQSGGNEGEDITMSINAQIGMGVDNPTKKVLSYSASRNDDVVVPETYSAKKGDTVYFWFDSGSSAGTVVSFTLIRDNGKSYTFEAGTIIEYNGTPDVEGSDVTMKVTGADGSDIPVGGLNFTMPAQNVIVDVTYTAPKGTPTPETPATEEPTSTPTPTSTVTPTPTATPTPTSTSTPTPSPTPTVTATATPTSTSTPVVTDAPVITVTPAPAVTPTTNPTQAPSAQLAGIRIKSNPSKTTVVEGTALDTSGLKVEAVYSDGKAEEITDYTLSGYDMNRIGTQTITVEYMGYTASFNITVAQKSMIGLVITQKPNKRAYAQGEQLDTAGMIVTAMYNNGTSEEITGYKVSGYDPNGVGSQTVSVSYNGFSAAFTVTISPKEQPAGTVETPKISISSFIGGKTVTLTTATEGAQIYYTLDGTAPSTSSNPYGGPITLTETASIKAIAVKDGMNPSKTAGGRITVGNTAAPASSHNAGQLEVGTVITLRSETSGSMIYYTTDGSNPTTESQKYSGGIAITTDVTIKAIAVKDGYKNSGIFEAAYTVPKIEPGSAAISVGSASGAAGDTISIPVYLFTEEESGITEYRFTMSYDASKFEYQSVTPAEGAEASDLFTSAGDGKVTVLYSGAAIESGEVCDINLKALESDEDGEYPISIQKDSVKIETGTGNKYNIDITDGIITLIGSNNSNLELRSDVMLTDPNGNDITEKHEATGRVTANVTLENANEEAAIEPMTVNIIMAVYDQNGCLVSMSVMDADLSDLNYVFTNTIDIPKGVEVGSIKLMIWNGLSEMTPMSAASEIL